jgi:hypothetical protein
MFEIPLLAGSKCQFFHQARAESPDVEPQGSRGARQELHSFGAAFASTGGVVPHISGIALYIYIIICVQTCPYSIVM